MLKVLIGVAKGFVDQPKMQAALRDLYYEDPDAFLVVDNSNAGSKLVGAIWSAIGGMVSNQEPLWRVHGKDAGRVRDDEVMRTGADRCMSFQIAYDLEVPWITKRCIDAKVPVHYVYLEDDGVIDAV